MGANTLEAPATTPAPRRAKSGLAALTSRKRPALSVEALAELNQLEELLGGRQAIIAALVTAPQSEALTWMVGLLADPARADQSLALICAEARILPTDLLEALILGKRARAKVYATHLATTNAGRIVNDIVVKAAPHEDRCYACKGTGKLPGIPTPEDKDPAAPVCDTCNGVGRLHYPAEEDARKLALDLAGLLSKAGGGVAISITQQQKTLNLVGGGGGATGGVGDGVGLQEAIDQILYGGQGAPVGDAGEDLPNVPADHVVDGELIPPDQPDEAPSRPDDPFAPERDADPVPTAAPRPALAAAPAPLFDPSILTASREPARIFSPPGRRPGPVAE